jgi:hypothetical protein
MKIRHILLTSLVLALALSFGASARKRGRSRSPKLLEKAEGPLTLTLESVGQQGLKAIVLISGVTRAPESRLFNFHTAPPDERHFIALDARCEAADQNLRCTLKLPRPYLKGHVVGMTVHLRGREIEADPRVVEALFAAARAPVPPDAGTSDAEPEDEDEDEADADTNGWELQDAGWRREDEADDTEEWKYLRAR